MKIYTFGAEDAPVLLLLPGTCCHWKSNFGAMIPLLADSFENQSILLDFRVCCKSQRNAPLLHLLAVKMHHAHRALADTDGANQNEQNAQPDTFQNHL